MCRPRREPTGSRSNSSDANALFTVARLKAHFMHDVGRHARRTHPPSSMGRAPLPTHTPQCCCFVFLGMCNARVMLALDVYMYVHEQLRQFLCHCSAGRRRLLKNTYLFGMHDVGGHVRRTHPPPSLVRGGAASTHAAMVLFCLPMYVQCSCDVCCRCVYVCPQRLPSTRTQRSPSTLTAHTPCTIPPCPPVPPVNDRPPRVLPRGAFPL